jgi:hypothetical protein
MNRDNDIDLPVVSPACSNTNEEHVMLLCVLRGLGFPIDVFIIGTARFEETKNMFGGITYPAHKYGRLICETSGPLKRCCLAKSERFSMRPGALAR